MQSNYYKIFKKQSIFVFRDNIWDAAVADMQLISKYDKDNFR